jgi:4-hydroxybenzoate polyprenyltransferase
MFERVINKIEQTKFSFLSFLAFFFSVVIIRDLLEVFSDIGNPWLIISPENFLLHYPLFFIDLTIILIIIINLFTNQNPIKTTKLFAFFLPIIWLAPIIDLLRGGADLRFIQFSSFSGFLNSLLNYFYIPPEGGVTVGILVETTIILLLLSAYIYIKTKSVIKSTIAFVVSYVFGKTLGSLTSLLNLFSSVFFPGTQKITVNTTHFSRVYLPEVKVSLVLFLLLIILLIIYFFLYSRKKLFHFIRYISLTRIIHYLFIFNSGVMLSVVINKAPISFFEYLMIFSANIVVVFGWIFLKGLNDYNDKKEDSVSNRENPFLGKLFSEKELIVIFTIIGLLLILGAAMINYEFFFIVLAILSIGFIYSFPPFRIKRLIFISHLSIAACVGLAYLLGLFLVKRYTSFAGIELNIFINLMILFFLASHLKDIKDFEGDKKAKILTFPTIFGLNLSKKVISALVFFSIILSLFLFRLSSLFPIGICFGLLEIYLINKQEYDEKPVFFVYFLYYLVIALNLAQSLS